MTRLLTAAGLTAGLVVFGAQNWEHVPIALLFGGPTRIRLVFLLAIAVGAGYVTAVLRGAGREVRLRRELRELRRILQVGVEPERPVVERQTLSRRRRPVRAEALPLDEAELEAFDAREGEA